ncbi:hypothetical protein KY335_03750 [Candidatus Woesearchaeota archaeon]|nr:hypothetical protein [Candidatus Woesearchaeota archaeon]MBW3014329.1 hypothetical protein [Candidatus Woesearchaeota archaeon]
MGTKSTIKPLKPSLKEQIRYIAFKIISVKEIKDFSKVNDAVLEHISMFIGELGMAKAGPSLIKNKWKQKEQAGVIKVNRRYVDHIKSSLSLIKEINNQRVIVKSISTSGMINKAGKAIGG